MYAYKKMYIYRVHVWNVRDKPKIKMCKKRKKRPNNG